MNDENKRIKIALLTMRRDPHDRQSWRSWSGTVYYVTQTLQKDCGDVSYLSPALPCRNEELIARIIRRSSQVLLKKKCICSFFLASSYAKAGAQWLAGQSFDVIVAPDGASDIAFLETDIPIVLIADATYGLLFDYYPAFSGLLQRSIDEMNTVQDLALKKASAVLYSSAWAARSAIEDYGADPAKVHVVPFGANLDEIPPREVGLARKLSDCCRLLFLAVDWARKGGDIAFETLLKLEELGIQTELIVCGCTPPKAFAHKHVKIVPFLDKNDKRQRRELEQLFMMSDFLLVPTRADCTPMVFCEANAFGLPVITTSTGGVPEVVRNGENGFLLPYDARGAGYAEVIARLYRDTERYAELVRASRAAFDNRLNWDAWGVTVKHILADLLDHEPSRSQQIEVRPKKVEDTMVEEDIPPPVQPLLDAYLRALEPLRSHFYGIYIFGSIAFGAFEERESDIDIVALTQGEWTTPELAQLNALHTELIGTHQLARRLDVLYLPLQSLGKCNREIAPYPTFLHGAFSPAGYGDLNSITWWTLKNNGIRLLGPERLTLPLEVTWQDVLKTMRDTLDGFWASKVRRPHRFLRDAGQAHLNAGTKAGRPRKTEQLLNVRSRDVLRKALEQIDALTLLRDALVLLRDDWCVFAVATHCRMLTTIEEGEIITKSVALKRWRDCLPARWRPLIDEAWRIRHHLGGPSLYRSRLKRMREILAFIKYVRKRGNKVLEDLLRKGDVKQCTASSHSWTISIINWLKTSGPNWRGSSQ